MKFSIQILLTIQFLTSSIVGIAQSDFVFFETTNNTNVVCQDKTLGVIANLLTIIEEGQNYQWLSDSVNIKKIKGEIAVVNTSTPGEKRLTFVLNISENHKLDTTIVINVLPKPVVDISYNSGELSFSANGDSEISSFKWVFNGSLETDFTDKVLKNPSAGTYRVLVFDGNGCSATSKEVVVK
ncbi:MAG TPA: hypothetical protein PK563_15955 [Tenuifilaceae bacterium]|nr:hypothetical protein [Tenuifilaceae bacterium]